MREVTVRLIYACRLDWIFEKRREESVIHHLNLPSSSSSPPSHSSFHPIHSIRFILRKRRPCQPHAENVIGIRYPSILHCDFAFGSTKPLSHRLRPALQLLLRSHSPVFLSRLFHRSYPQCWISLRRKLSIGSILPFVVLCNLLSKFR